MKTTYPRLKTDERLLVQGCRDGDEQAWLSLYRAYGRDVGSFLKGMLRDHAEVDDLVQRVFLEFLSSIQRFRGESSLRTWLLGIARNLAMNEIRSRGRREKYVRAYGETINHTKSSLDDQIHARHQLNHVQRLLGRLEPDFREVWLLRELNGCSVAETAIVLGLEEATVRTRHFRARKHLLHLLNIHAKAPPQPKTRTGVPLQLVQSEDS